MSQVEIHLDLDELHYVINALQTAGSEQYQEIADRLLLTTTFTRKQLVEVYECDVKRVKALSNPGFVKHWGDGQTHYFRLSHPEVTVLMRESKNPAAHWIVAQYLLSEARCQATVDSNDSPDAVRGLAT